MFVSSLFSIDDLAIWNEGFLFSKPAGNAILHIDTLSKDRIKINSADNIGTSEVDISQYLDQVPVTLNLPTKYGSITIKIDNPMKSQSFGNTRTSQVSTSASLNATTSSTRPSLSRPTSHASLPPQNQYEEEMPDDDMPPMNMGRGGLMGGRGRGGMMGGRGRGGMMGYPPMGRPQLSEQSSENGEEMPPPMFPMHFDPRMRPPPPMFHHHHRLNMDDLKKKYDKWGNKLDSDETASVSSQKSQSSLAQMGGRGGRGGRMGRPGGPPPFPGQPPFGGRLGFPGRFGGRWNPHMHMHEHHEQMLAQFDPSFTQLDDDEKFTPPTELPEKFEETDEEKQEKLKRWARFAAFLAKPFDYDSKYKEQLQQLDAMGAINLDRVSRHQIPSLNINLCAALFFNPYEGLSHELGDAVVADALRMATLFKARGYRLVYICDATPMGFYRWMDWLIQHVQAELMVYFAGHSTKVIDPTKNAVSDVLVFYDASQKAPPQGMMRHGHGPQMVPIQGLTQQTIDDSCFYSLVANKERVDTRITFITDSCTDSSMFASNERIPSNAQHLPTPPNMISIKTSLAANGTPTSSSLEFFAKTFSEFLAKNAGATFKDLQSQLARGKPSSFSVSFATSDNSMLTAAIIPTVEEAAQEVQIEEITEEVLGDKIENITSIPEEDVPSQVEQEIAQVRWQTFCEELAKPAPYTSKYKTYLQKLDAMGAINLERITRDQIPPNIYIDNCIVMFFNPYEDLPHTLDAGPVNDALLMTELYLSRNYHVMYICDATPHEYYRWMDWLLDNVHKDLVVFFSGHGTQIKDTSGREEDGLSEVMVFYDSTRKKNADKTGKVEKITAVDGITNETVSDSCMFDLITSKEYPDTRVVTITDCCHSGTMFNFDQNVPTNGQGITPPINVVCIGSAQDSETAKQTSFQGVEAGVFTYNFTNYLKTKPNCTFIDLQTYMKKQIM